MLLIIIFLQAGGSLLVYKARQFYIQYQMELSLQSNNAEFEKLILTEAEYEQSKYKSHELIYLGNMYDIKSVKYVSGKVELIVLHDKEEKEILNFIQGIAAETEENEGNNTIPLQLQSFLSIPYVMPDSGFQYHESSVNLFAGNSDKRYLINFPGDIPSPPPKG